MIDKNLLVFAITMLIVISVVIAVWAVWKNDISHAGPTFFESLAKVFG